MNLLTKETLRNLIETQGEICVSIYIPTERVGQEAEQNPIRLKNMLAKAEDLLKKSGLRQPEVDAVLNPARELVDQRPFWQHQSDGLVIFLSPEMSSVHQLPLEFEEQIFVGKNFYLKPIFPLLSGDGSFYLLRLDMEQPAVFQGSRYAMEAVEVPDMPGGMDYALRFDDPERSIQHKTTSRTNGGHDAIYHGHGNGYDKKENILRYFHQIDNVVKKLLAEETAPLILAGVNYLLPIYRETNEYPHLLEQGIGVDVAEMQSSELHQRAWEIVKPHFQSEQKEARERYFVARDRGLASHDLKEIVPAAFFGRVDTLFITLGEQRWGTFDPETSQVEIMPEQEARQDLLDLAAVHALTKGAAVYAVDAADAPDDGAAAAIFRY